MTLQIIFWILMLLWLVFGLWQNWPGANPPSWGWFGNTILLFILFLILGWAVFGSPVKAEHRSQLEEQKSSDSISRS